MFRSLFVLALLVVSATTWAQPAPTTDKAQESETAAERKVAQLVARQKTLAQHFQDELAAVDQLKKQRPSWRRDRELNDSQAESAETAKQLEAATREVTAAQATLTTAQRTLVAAIDAELAAGASGARAQKLTSLRGQLAPKVGPAAHKIVIPDVDLDADPEDLDQQAAALRESEAQLSGQVAGLEAQGKELDRVAVLRRQHERAGELGTRDDDQSHRNPAHSTSGGAVTGADGTGTGAGSPAPTNTGGGAPPPGNPGGAGLFGDHGSSSGFESEASVVLKDVVDGPTIDGLNRAQRSGDPGQRAVAVKKTRDAVAARLERLRKTRAEVEARAKSLRGKH
jgi:hypothetical protein